MLRGWHNCACILQLLSSTVRFETIKLPMVIRKRAKRDGYWQPEPWMTMTHWYCPILLLVGKSCFVVFLQKLEHDPALKLKMVPLKFTFKIFSKRASFYAAYSSATGQLQHPTFYTPHTSRFLLGVTCKRVSTQISSGILQQDRRPI